MSNEYFEFPGGAVRKEDVVAYEKVDGWGRLMKWPAVLAFFFISAAFILGPLVNTGDEWYQRLIPFVLGIAALFASIKFLRGGPETAKELGLATLGKWIVGLATLMLILALLGLMPHPDLPFEYRWKLNQYQILSSSFGILCGLLCWKLPALMQHTVHKVTLRNGNVIQRNTWGN
jgi:hypothetical protein